jgi:hypothetical protein
VAFAALGSFLALSSDTRLFVKAAAANLADNSCLLYLFAEPLQQALEALAFMNSDLCQWTSTPLFLYGE